MLLERSNESTSEHEKFQQISNEATPNLEEILKDSPIEIPTNKPKDQLKERENVRIF